MFWEMVVSSKTHKKAKKEKLSKVSLNRSFKGLTIFLVEEKDISEQRTIKLELFRDDELVAFAFGQNKAVISNVALYPTNNKDEPRSYLLQARFDLREWPECKEVEMHFNLSKYYVGK